MEDVPSAACCARRPSEGLGANEADGSRRAHTQAHSGSNSGGSGVGGGGGGGGGGRSRTVVVVVAAATLGATSGQQRRAC
uniref:Uncharacterized protein n=1 Tax=Anopheles dirus TaxID=7168 RepID=A0A182N035_9DIPT